MEKRIVDFIAGLRAAGLRISLAESTDAFEAVAGLGIQDRQTFRLSLRATLVKDAQNLQIFDHLFPFFFGSGEMAPLLNPSADLSPEEANVFAEALEDYEERLKHMLERLARGKMLTSSELERLAKMVGLTQADDLRYQAWMVARLKKALRYKQVRAALENLAGTLSQMGMDKRRAERLVQQMIANQRSLEKQLHQYAGKRIIENMDQGPPQPAVDELINRPFNALSEREMKLLRHEVRRLAAVLKTRIALRQKRARSGQLDAKATIRANLIHGNVPIVIKHRERSLKPRLVVICDVSTSMRFCSELMLSLLYHLQDQISKTQAFAFIDHLEYISPQFSGRPAGEAVQQVLNRMPSGHYNTDLGNSLDDFERGHLDTVDRRTTLILVGDGRNNFNNPRLDIFDRLARRSRRTIWLNPEAAALWGSGDSDMLEYARKCDVILHVSNLAQLTSAVDNLLAA
jgi:uncharacterized protein with von Willebrand factor type A (vWA) domain